MSKINRRNKKEIEFVVKDSIFPTIGVGEYEGRQVRVKGAFPQQRIRGRYLRNKKGIGEIELLEVIERAPYEIEAKCPHFDLCGGCISQNIPYEIETENKEREVLKLFKENDLDLGVYEGILASKDRFYYRNKMEYTFGDFTKGGNLELGMHVKKRRSSVTTINNCVLVSEDFNRIINACLGYFREKGDKHYRVLSREGFLRNLIIREGKNTKELMVILVVTSQGQINKEEFLKILKSLELSSELTSVYLVINDSLQDAVVAERVELLYGKSSIKEVICNLEFKITPFSFFQTNSKGAEVLYNKVLEYAGDIENKVVFDLYCGTGTIGNILATKAKFVKGVEIIEEAAQIAGENAINNKLFNVEFLPGDVKDVIKDLKEKPDLIVLDPPRSGIHPKALEYALAFNAKEIIYVSCNPKTQVEDLKVMTKYYKIEKSILIENYPNTSHVECVVLMSRVAPNK